MEVGEGHVVGNEDISKLYVREEEGRNVEGWL